MARWPIWPPGRRVALLERGVVKNGGSCCFYDGVRDLFRPLGGGLFFLSDRFPAAADDGLRAAAVRRGGSGLCWRGRWGRPRVGVARLRRGPFVLVVAHLDVQLSREGVDPFDQRLLRLAGSGALLELGHQCRQGVMGRGVPQTSKMYFTMHPQTTAAAEIFFPPAAATGMCFYPSCSPQVYSMPTMSNRSEYTLGWGPGPWGWGQALCNRANIAWNGFGGLKLLP